MDPQKRPSHKPAEPKPGPDDKRPRPHQVQRALVPVTPGDATGINAKDRCPIDPGSPYLPPQ